MKNLESMGAELAQERRTLDGRIVGAPVVTLDSVVFVESLVFAGGRTRKKPRGGRRLFAYGIP